MSKPNRRLKLPFNVAFATESSFFTWMQEPQNRYAVTRFAVAMQGTEAVEVTLEGKLLCYFVVDLCLEIKFKHLLDVTIQDLIGINCQREGESLMSEGALAMCH
jgi:hypothetical protein